MGTLRIVGDYYFVKYYDPILVISSMLILLVSLLVISKLFFWLAFDKPQSNKELEPTELISGVPDILMQKKENDTYLDYSIKTTNYYSISNVSKVIAIVISLLLVFTFFGDLLNPF